MSVEVERSAEDETTTSTRRIKHRACCQTTGVPGFYRTFCGITKTGTPVPRSSDGRQDCVVCADLIASTNTCPEGLTDLPARTGPAMTPAILAAAGAPRHMTTRQETT